jgi:hypothetical protein
MAQIAITNKWRRIGALVWLVWFFAAASLAAYEWIVQTSGVFAYRTLLAGTTLDVEKNEAILPDGRIVQLKQSLASLEPWEVNWNDEPEAAPMLVPNRKRFLRLGIVLPVFIWLLVELAAASRMRLSKTFGRKNAI